MLIKNDSSLVKEEEVCILFSLRKAARIVTSLYDTAMRKTGYRATQITLLGVLNRHVRVTAHALAGFIDTDRTTLSRNLKLLKDDGLIHYRIGEDRREREVVLSPKGKRVLAKAYPIWKTIQEKITAAVGSQELSRSLERLNHILECMPRVSEAAPESAHE